MSEEDNRRAEIKRVLDKVSKGMRVTKITCTRSVKGPGGDTFVGYSAVWDSVQEDGGRGLDEVHEAEGENISGFTPQEARVASLLLGMQADIAAYHNAGAGGCLSARYVEDAVSSIKRNYSNLIQDEFAPRSGRGGES